MLTRRTFLAAPLLAQRRPPANVLFLAADDMNNALGCYGHPVVKTPNIDRLASRSVRFERAYCQFPLCGPSRASLLTGLRPDVTRVLGNNIDFRDFHPDAVTLPQLFKNNGYFSAREGKMFHMNVPTEVTLPRFQDEKSWNHSVSPGGPEAKSEGQRRATTERGRQFGMEWVATPDGKGQSDSNAADHAIALLEAHRKDPFFLGVGFIRPHLPFVAPARFFDLYPLNTLPLPENPPNDLDDIPKLARSVRPQLWNHMGMNENGIRESRRGYFASTSFMDEQLGRVSTLSRSSTSPKTRSSSSGATTGGTSASTRAGRRCPSWRTPPASRSSSPLQGARATAKCTAASPSSSTSIPPWLNSAASLRPPISPELPWRRCSTTRLAPARKPPTLNSPTRRSPAAASALTATATSAGKARASSRRNSTITSTTLLSSPTSLPGTRPLLLNTAAC